MPSSLLPPVESTATPQRCGRSRSSSWSTSSPDVPLSPKMTAERQQNVRDRVLGSKRPSGWKQTNLQQVRQRVYDLCRSDLQNRRVLRTGEGHVAQEQDGREDRKYAVETGNRTVLDPFERFTFAIKPFEWFGSGFKLQSLFCWSESAPQL